MVDPVTSKRFMFRCVFLALCVLLIFIKMLPLSTIPATIPGPDLLFCLTAVWIMRRPRWAPVGMIVLIHLVADLLFLRPPGLWTAISLLGYEYLRGKASGSTEITAPLEVGMAATVFAAMVGANAAFHLVFGIPQASLGVLLIHIIMTVVAYPFVIAFSAYIVRVRRARPSDLDGSGIPV